MDTYTIHELPTHRANQSESKRRYHAEPDGDGWLWRRWTDRRTGKSYSVEYASTEHEDARTIMIHRRNGRSYIEKGQ